MISATPDDGPIAWQRADEGARITPAAAHGEVERRERDGEAERTGWQRVQDGSEPQHAGRERTPAAPGEDRPVHRRRATATAIVVGTMPPR